jgi:hypothetical protein
MTVLSISNAMSVTGSHTLDAPVPLESLIAKEIDTQHIARPSPPLLNISTTFC